MARIKSRERYHCGKLRPDLERQETASPNMIRAIIDQAKRGAANPLLRTELGRLLLRDVLSGRQVMAGTRFAAVMGAYDRAKGLPRRSVASPSYQSGYGRSPQTDREDDEIIEALAGGAAVVDLAKHSPRLKKVLKAERQYDGALDSLSSLGYRVQKAVMAVAVYDEIIVSGEYLDLRAGLDALANHFRLTGR